MSKMPKELEDAIRAREKRKKLHRDNLFHKHGIETEDDIRDRLQRDKDRQYAAIPLETKQRFLDLFWEGKSLGTAAREAGIDILMASEVILRNAVSHIPTKAEK